jgi:hypothetical protein
MHIKEKLIKLMSLYGINGEIKEYSQITNGHINETYYVSVENGQSVNPYVFQKVNTYVFKEPVKVMNNIMMIDNFIKNNVKKARARSSRFCQTTNTETTRRQMTANFGAYAFSRKIR